MHFSLVYLINRFFFRLSDFFHHWYIDGSKKIGHWGISVFESFDRALAFRITLKYFWRPLYKDYSFVGRILGVVFRSGRLFIGAIAYFFLGLAWAGIYLFWLLLPFVILLSAYRGLFMSIQ